MRVICCACGYKLDIVGGRVREIDCPKYQFPSMFEEDEDELYE